MREAGSERRQLFTNVCRRADDPSDTSIGGRSWTPQANPQVSSNPGQPSHRIPTEAEATQREVEPFDDPSQEWRRLFSELLGTFFLVLVAAGGGMMGQAFPDTISRTAAVVAPGLMVLGVILFMGKVSGAHLNPAVSIAFALRGDFPWRRVPGYIVVQLVGAMPGRVVPAGRRPRLGLVRVELPGAGVLRVRRVRDGDGADLRAGQRHPRHRVRRAERRRSSARSASAATSRWPACGAARSPARR